MSDGTAHAEFAVTLPFGPEAARVARSMVGQLLTDHECDDRLVEDGRLVVHELVMNGVRHGEPDARAEIAVAVPVLEAHVVISVLDQGRRGSVAARPPSGRASTGAVSPSSRR